MLTKKQLAARALACGASEIATIAGLSKWEAPIKVYERKVSGDDFEGTIATELGDLLEEPIAKLAAKQTGLVYMRVDTLTRATHPYAVATPDRAGFATREGLGDLRRKLRTPEELKGAVELLQVKHTTMRLRSEWGENGSDGVPDYYYPQGIWECGVAGATRVVFAVLFDKHEFALFPIEANPTMFAALYEIAERFFVDYVLPKRPPPPDASDRYAEFLNKTYASSNGALVTPTAEIEAKIWQWAKLKAGQKRCETLAKQIGNELKAVLGNDYGFAAPTFGKLLWIRPSKPTIKIDHAAVLGELLGALDTLLGPEPTAQALAAAVKLHAADLVTKHTTSAFQGAKLSPYFGKKTPVGLLKSQPLELQLALPDGNEPDEESAAA